ncbi:unnamed protein product [Alopecurus aequalis]
MIYLTCARPFVACCLHIILFLACFSFTYSSATPSSPPRLLLLFRLLQKTERSVSSAAAHGQFSLHKLLVGSVARRSCGSGICARQIASVMGLEVADISELAPLRPIHTTAVTGAQPTPDDDAASVADTACVTPTATRAGAAACAADDDGAPAADGIGSATPTASGPMGAPQRDAGADNTCYATPTAGRTTAPIDGAAAGEAACFTTPTSEDSALRPATVCPPAPAPRKLAPALKRKLAPLQQRLFYPVPRDLATVFTPAAKKMRAHSVESSLPLGT